MPFVPTVASSCLDQVVNGQKWREDRLHDANANDFMFTVVINCRD